MKAWTECEDCGMRFPVDSADAEYGDLTGLVGFVPHGERCRMVEKVSLPPLDWWRTVEAMQALGWKWTYTGADNNFVKEGVDGFVTLAQAQAALDAAERGETWTFNETANEA